MNQICVTNMVFDFIHIPVLHLSNAALPFRERFMRVPSMILQNLKLDPSRQSF